MIHGKSEASVKDEDKSENMSGLAAASASERVHLMRSFTKSGHLHWSDGVVGYHVRLTL